MEDNAPKLRYTLSNVLDEFVESELITEKQKKAFETETSYRKELGLLSYVTSRNYYDFLKTYLKEDNDYHGFLYDLIKIYPEYNRYNHDSEADKKIIGNIVIKKRDL